MGREQWYRRTTWTEDDRREFTARLARSRTSFHKAQYLRIQALHLEQAGGEPLLRAALELLDEAQTNHPEPTQSALCWQQRARCLAALGDSDAALRAYLESHAAMRDRPNVRTDSHLGFAMLVVKLGLETLYDEALTVLDEFGGTDPFPVQRFTKAAARALIASRRGQLREARAHAQEALTAAALQSSPFRSHPRLGLVGDVDRALLSELRGLAAG